MIVVRYEDGKVVEVLDCKDVSVAQYGTLLQEATKNREELARKRAVEDSLAKAKADEEAREKRVRDYYSPSKLLIVVDSLLNSYQDGEYDKETHDRLTKAKNALFMGADVKGELEGFPLLKEAYEAIYGGIEL